MKPAIRATAALFATACVIALSGTAPVARADTFVPTTGAVFSDPLNASGVWRVQDHFIQLINAADPGSQINVAEYLFTTQPVADALVAASHRGVQVRVVVDYGSASATTKPGYVLLTQNFADFDSLTTDQRRTESWIQTCTKDRACLSGASATKNPIQHNKFLLFTSVAGKKVVVEASQNLNSSNQWNNAVTIVGDDQLYNVFVTYFNRLAHNEHNNLDVYNDFGGTGSTNSTKAWFFPRAVPSSGNQNSNDTIGDILGNTTCKGARIMIGMKNLDDDRLRVATDLANCAKAGATVQIVYSAMGTKFQSTLKGVTRVTLYRMPTTLPLIHSKYMIIDGAFTGTAGKWIFTGSHNYDRDSLRDNDESLLRLNNAGIFAQYEANWGAMRAVASKV